MKVRACIAFAAIAAGTSGCGDVAAPGQPSPVDAVFADYATPEGPGCSVGVFEHGALTWARGYGMANLDHGIPNDSRTVFRTGSVSKQFTAGAVALLAVEGRLDLDAPVHDYVAGFPTYPDPPTVRHLVHHTSGVRDYIVLMALAGNRDEDYYTNDDVLAMIKRQTELNFRPGDEFLYSNAGYFLLGEIVRAVTGQSLRAFGEERFFQPLGMTHTHFHDNHNEIVRNRAVGYRPTDGGFEVFMTTLDMVGDGGIFTSVEDWAAWDRNLDTGEVGGPEWVHQMLQRGVLNSGDTIPYAFGIAHGTHRGSPTVGHGGSWVGFRAGMVRYPELGTSFVALCNRSGVDPMGLLVATADSVLGGRLGAPDPPPPETDRERSDEPAADRVAEFDAAPYVGSYHSPELDVTYVVDAPAGGGVWIRVGRWPEARLVESRPGVLHDDRGVTYRFAEPDGGRYARILVDAGRVKNLRFARVPPANPRSSR